MPIYSLYIKTHQKTGLKYLGKTIRDPFNYNGSGIRWSRHLEKHGNDVSTQIIGQYSTKEELKENGLYFSKLFNVVESEEWANLTVEEGQGGGVNKGRKIKPCSYEHRQKLSESMLGKNTGPKPIGFGKKISEARKKMIGIKRGPYKPRSEKTRAEISIRQLGKKRGPYGPRPQSISRVLSS